MFSRCILSGLDVAPLLEQIAVNPELWNSDTSWVSPNTPYRPDNIVLRQVHDGNWSGGIRELHFSQWDRPARRVLAAVEPILAALKAAVGCDVLGKVGITRMAPGAVLAPHVDVARRPVLFERYQVPLDAQEGVSFIVGGERIDMRPGEAWWFDKATVHSVENFSPAPRLAMVVEMRSA